jgi:hypothetical protein
MTLKEIHLRAAHWDWVEAKKAWVKAVRDINEAKQTWDRCQAEFYGENLVQIKGADNEQS